MLISLNINGISSKIENQTCVQLFQKYDIVCLSELKCIYPFSVPGFRVIRSKVVHGEEQRGGVAVMFKHEIWPYVYDIRVKHDQVWFKLEKTPGFQYGAVYIAPRDSPYHDASSFAQIQEQIMMHNMKSVVLGDVNARIPDLTQFNDTTIRLSYAQNIDTKQNMNGKDIAYLCHSCGLKPLNHLLYNDKHFVGGLTFRQKHNWISQLDWAFISTNALKNVQQFDILNGVVLPTNHAPLAVELTNFDVSYQDLLTRAKWLDSDGVIDGGHVKPAISMHNIDVNSFAGSLPEIPNEWYQFDAQNIDVLCEEVSEMLYVTAVNSRYDTDNEVNVGITHSNAYSRWQYLLEHGDAKQIWQAVNWSGSFDTPSENEEKPSDDAFCAHYEQLLNPTDDQTVNYEPSLPKYVPVLDDAISQNEVSEAVNSLKSNKAAGVDGVPPGVLKLVNAQWIMFLTFLFNIVFFGSYPLQWTVSKVFNIFKKGARSLPSNYRGISIMIALAKLYDIILSARFKLWYNPKYEQAGAQKGRGCEEQILTIRMLIDIARKCKYPLYITFIDYQKAYDKVNRLNLLRYLDSRGCGSTFLKAVKAAMMNSCGQIGNQSFSATAGVRQGASTSCPLFTFFIEPTIDACAAAGPDSWLGYLHSLLLMDDTVVFATSRLSMERKLRNLKSCVDDIGMVIHPTKSRFLSVNTQDQESFVLDNVAIEHTESYVYLGSHISVTSVSQQVKDHMKNKASHVFKFSSFLTKNSDAPFSVKQTVWNSALKSAIFYGCETWLTNDLKVAESVYLSTLKQMLGVRSQICTDVVYVECGITKGKNFIQQRQAKFLYKVMERDQYDGSYLQSVIDLALQKKSPMGRYIQHILDNGCGHDYESEGIESAKNAIRNSTSTHRATYYELNPELSKCAIYNQSANIPEHARIACTRMRLSSHYLKIETGRWSRIPRENRLCICGQIQTEEHVLLECVHTEKFRQECSVTGSCSTISDLMNRDENEMILISMLCYRVLDYFKNIQQ